jgi:transcriptional regulator with XRE-family HTH domain
MIGNKLKAARLRAKLTQAQLGRAAGLDQSAVSQIERGAFSPTMATLKALAEALGTTAADLDHSLSAPVVDGAIRRAARAARAES